MFVSRYLCIRSSCITHARRGYTVGKVWSKMNRFDKALPSRGEMKLDVASLDKRLGELEKLSASDEAYLPLSYSTLPKNLIKELVCTAASDVVKGNYAHSRGENSRLLLGAKGIGKSSTLHYSCIALSTMNSKLSPIYIQYSSAGSEMVTPLEAINNNLKSRDLRADHRSLQDIAITLLQNGIFVLLVVDELDMLYERSNDTKALQVLDELRFIASDPSGCFYTVACGSSSALPLLVTKNGALNDSIKTLYPLVVDAPNLNGSKFPSYRLGVGLLSNTEMEVVLKERQSTKGFSFDITPAVLNFFRLVSGPNIRKMRQLFDIAFKSDYNALMQLLLPYDQNDSKSLRTMEELGPLINETVDRLVQKNNHLLEGITPTTPYSDLVTRDWSKLVPLENEELQDIIKCLQEKDIKVEMSHYFKLIDTNWFIADADLSSLQPQIPVHLIFRKIAPQPSKAKIYANRLAASIKESTTNGSLLGFLRELL